MNIWCIMEAGIKYPTDDDIHIGVLLMHKK